MTPIFLILPDKTSAEKQPKCRLSNKDFFAEFLDCQNEFFLSKNAFFGQKRQRYEFAPVILSAENIFPPILLFAELPSQEMVF